MKIREETREKQKRSGTWKCTPYVWMNGWIREKKGSKKKKRKNKRKKKEL